MSFAGCQSISSLLCDAGICGSSSAPRDSPGNFSYYAIITFTNNAAYPPLACQLDSYDGTCFTVNQYLAQPLLSVTPAWNLQTGVTDGYINGVWASNPTTASNISSLSGSFAYLTTHGGIINNQAQLCLRNCDGQTIGGTASFGTQTIPAAWNGPNWLILDSCEVAPGKVCRKVPTAA
jgi:hypothetical protein